MEGQEMKKVQIAIGDKEYAAVLRDLLMRDGTHHVAVVDQPDPALNGVIIIDGEGTSVLLAPDSKPERFVVIARKRSDVLGRIWDSGVRHVLFEGDPPDTAQLAIIAAE